MSSKQLSKGLYALTASLPHTLKCKSWTQFDVNTHEKVERLSNEEAAREEDALLTHEECGRLDNEDYISANVNSVRGCK